MASGMDAPTIGLLIVHKDCNTSTIGKDTQWVARRYNAQTEELDANPMDETSLQNLRQQMEPLLSQTAAAANSSSRQSSSVSALTNVKIIPQEQLFSQNPKTHSLAWQHSLTHLISQKVLHRHGLTGNGDKIVPGTYTEHDEEISGGECHATKSDENKKGPQQTDGTSLQYCPLPCLESTILAPTSSSFKRRHLGTQRFLRALTPPERTFLHTIPPSADPQSSRNLSPQDMAFKWVLERSYENDWRILLGEWQLSFIVFIGCACWSSLQHWRDVIGMLSLTSRHSLHLYPQLYSRFLQTLLHQCQLVSLDVLEDADYSQGHFLLPAIERLHSLVVVQQQHQQQQVEQRDGNEGSMSLDPRLKELTTKLLNLISDAHGGGGVSMPPKQENVTMDNDEMISVPEDGTGVDISSWNDATSCFKQQGDGFFVSQTEKAYNYDEDEEDGPMMVPWEDVQASMERSQRENDALTKQDHIGIPNQVNDDRERHSGTYPLLFAAMREKEDVVMTCARILGDGNDVSLVREAAAYLEQVEAKRS